MCKQGNGYLPLLFFFLSGTKSNSYAAEGCNTSKTLFISHSLFIFGNYLGSRLAHFEVELTSI